LWFKEKNMTSFDTYRNIRKGAVIFGLPIPLFALCMVSVIGSLLIIIFAFSMTIIASALLWNLGLYILLLRMSNRPLSFTPKGRFPKHITNKFYSGITYEKT
tara:strand:+ start:5295 stop:5600 length:306 start_codon:yes stop_codon:yes gene_type:complete